MLSQVAVEALYSATYVETYLDSVENLPDDIQRYLSRIREIDVQYRDKLRDVDIQYELWSNCSTSELELVNTSKRSRAMARIQQCLIAAQELGDEKLQIVTQLQELIDHKTRQLDHDFKNLDYGKDEPILEIKEQRISSSSPTLNSPISTVNPQPIVAALTATGTVVVSTITNIISNDRLTTTSNTSNSNNERSSKRARRTRTDTNTGSGNNSGSGNAGMDIGNSDSNLNTEAQVKPLITQSNNAVQKKVTAAASGSGKKKKRKTRGSGAAQTNITNQIIARDTREDTPPAEEPIDPDEPTYCLCDQISFGEMILCDNDLCPIEWFHFSCVSLMSKPKGKWFCPNCRGDRPNVMKPKAQFLKELERYNKEKEEKT